MVVDIGRVFQLHAGWEAALPDIHPFYAVKCNEDKLLLKTLAALGTGFDCASKVSELSVQGSAPLLSAAILFHFVYVYYWCRMRSRQSLTLE